MEDNEDGWVEVQEPTPPPAVPKYVPMFPFPQRQQRHQQNNKFQQFLTIFINLIINIPFVKAFEQMPSYATFL